MKDDEGWMPPQRKPVTKEALNRATGAEEGAAPQEHQVREAWFDGQHGTVMLELTDGRVFGVEPSFIPSLQEGIASVVMQTTLGVNGPGTVVMRPSFPGRG